MSRPMRSKKIPLIQHRFTKVVLPDLTLQLSFNNIVQTCQYEMMLYIVPTYLIFWDEFRNRRLKPSAYGTSERA